MSSITRELEARIGAPPFGGDNTLRIMSHEQRLNIRAWLVSKGLNTGRVNRMQDKTLEAAYNVRAYYYRITDDPKNMARRDSYEARHVGADVFDESSDASHAMHGNVNAAIFAEPVAPPVHPNEGQGISEDRLAQIKADLEKHVENKIKNTKLELSDDAKKLIRSLATDAGRELFNELMPPRTLRIEQSGTHEAKDLGLQHFKFEALLKACCARDDKGNRLNIWLTGDTASGKTTAAVNVAWALDLEFGSDGSLDADYKVMGFRNAAGEIVSTTFLDIYSKGGIYIADEIDNWLPSALLSLNSALANGWVFSNGKKYVRHPDCIIIACANTWGLGATNDYVGRSKLDQASLNRFIKIHWPYDEKLEHAIAVARGGEAWCRSVQNYRAKAKAQGIKIIISPRATFYGIALLAQGFSELEVIDMTFAAELKPEQRAMLGIQEVMKPEAATRPLDSNTLEQFKSDVTSGRMIDAIRTWRHVYGADLSSAKSACEQIRDGLRSMPSMDSHPNWRAFA